MPGFGDSAFIVILALLLFGPKKLPVLARQLGKLMGDFRRASNEFRTQMEEELRISEQADRQKEIAALEAAAPPTPVIEPAPASDNPHIPPPAPSFAASSEDTTGYPIEYPGQSEAGAETTVLPIATSGELSILPPSTGLPIANSPADSSGEIAAPAPDRPLQNQTEPPRQGPPAAEPTAQPTTSDHEAEFETETLHG